MVPSSINRATTSSTMSSYEWHHHQSSRAIERIFIINNRAGDVMGACIGGSMHRCNNQRVLNVEHQIDQVGDESQASN
jgi:hypothetical protein